MVTAIFSASSIAGTRSSFTSPARSIIRKRGSDDSLPPSPNTATGNRNRSVDYQGQSPHEVTKHVRKWQDYVGVTDQTKEDSFENAPVEKKEKWKTHQKNSCQSPRVVRERVTGERQARGRAIESHGAGGRDKYGQASRSTVFQSSARQVG